MNSKRSITNKLRSRIFPIAGMILVFVISCMVLYFGDNVGLSDNGDFRRVLITNNISYEDETNHYYLFKEHYVMELDDKGLISAAVSAWKTNHAEDIYTSPHFLLIRISKEMNIIANAVSGRPLSEYNIVYLALLYIFMLSVAAGVLLTFLADMELRIQIAVFVLFVIMFCDAGYLLYANSFYGEPLQYTALLMLVSFGLMIYKRPSIPKVIGFYISLYFFAGAKLANVPYSLLAAFLGIFIMIMRRDKLFKLGVVVCAIICICNIIGIYRSIPDWMNNDTTYQAVFFGITKDSPDPAADLAELGVDKKYAPLAGTHAYMDADEYPIDTYSDEFKHDFYEKVSKADIAWFYIKHPIRLIKELSVAIENSAYIRPPVLGNSGTVPMEMTDRFSGWSKLRVSLRFLYEPWVIFAAFLIITGYMIFMNIFYIHNHKIEAPEKKYMICSLDMLILGLWVNLVLPIVGNGEGDITKHMFLFTNCVDILFFVCISGLLLMNRKSAVKALAAVFILNGIFYVHLPKKTMRFGRFNGIELVWNVQGHFSDGSLLLVLKDSVVDMPFDDDTNDWENSNLRKWLNTEFTAEFTREEKNRIMLCDNSVPLTYEDRERAESGNHAHYWNFTRKQVNDMGSTAYRYTVRDRVYIPTLEMMRDTDARGSYWILCPYTSNSFLQRYVNNDGFILHTDVSANHGVRAVIRVKDV